MTNSAHSFTIQTFAGVGNMTAEYWLIARIYQITTFTNDYCLCRLNLYQVATDLLDTIMIHIIVNFQCFRDIFTIIQYSSKSFSGCHM